MKSLKELQELRDKMKAQVGIREDTPDNIRVVVGMATCGIAAGARDVMNTLIRKTEKEKIPAVITQTGCMGYCHAEPTVEITKPDEAPVVFGHVDTKKADEIIDKYIKNGELLEGIIPMNYQTID